jgi:hypothetical protein
MGQGISMGKVFAQFLLKALGVIGPFVLPWVLKFSLTSGGDDHREKIVRAGLSLLGLTLGFGFDMYEYIAPKKRALDFGSKYAKRVIFAELKDKLTKDQLAIGADIRISVFFARRAWWTLFILHYFAWFVHDGFQEEHGHHLDRKVVLMTFQGLAGKAYREEKPQFMNLSGVNVLAGRWRDLWLFGNQFRLTYWQLRKTSDVKAILSVPIFYEKKPPPDYEGELVGVINVDAVSTAGADWLEKNWGDVARFVHEHGAIIAPLA